MRDECGAKSISRREASRPAERSVGVGISPRVQLFFSRVASVATVTAICVFTRLRTLVAHRLCPHIVPTLGAYTCHQYIHTFVPCSWVLPLLALGPHDHPEHQDWADFCIPMQVSWQFLWEWTICAPMFGQRLGWVDTEHSGW